MAEARESRPNTNYGSAEDYKDDLEGGNFDFDLNREDKVKSDGGEGDDDTIDDHGHGTDKDGTDDNVDIVA